MPKKLLDEDEGGEQPIAGGLNLNNEYATRYDQWRKKEELQRLKDRYGDAAEGDEEESSEESEPEEWTSEHEKQFLLALSALKSKDAVVFNKETTFFNTQSAGEASKPSSSKTNKSDTLYLKDYERKVVLERQGKFSSDEEEDDDVESTDKLKKRIASAGSMVDEQNKLKASFKAVIDAPDSDEEDGKNGLLQTRTKTADDQKREDADYLNWLAGRADEDASLLSAEQREKLDSLRQYWQNPDLPDAEKYLRDFILNRRYETPQEDNVIPTYDQVVNFEPDLESDDDELEKQATFEHKYNFRYEEPDAEFIKQYPRTINESVRRDDTKRKEQRESHKQRKQKEKQQRKEDIGRLKALKRAEIADRIARLRDATGDASIRFDPTDLEKDFDPAEYDAKMKELFTDDYYGDERDDEKPVFSDLSDDEFNDDDWDNWQATANQGDQEEDAAGDQPSTSQPKPTKKDKTNAVLDGISKKKSKRKNKLAEALSKKKPVFDPKAKSFQEYYDEYYQLDCEDVIGDLPVRFRYRQVPQNDYGLTADEVLIADDRELNAWASLNKMSQYRPVNEEEYDRVSWSRKAANLQKKHKLLPSVFKKQIPEESDKPDEEIEKAAGEQAGEPEKKKRRRQKKKRTNAELVVGNTAGGEDGEKKVESNTEQSADQPQPVSVTSEDLVKPVMISSSQPNTIDSQKTNVKRKRKALNRRGGHEAKKPSGTGTLVDSLTDDRLKAYGINPNKFRNKLKYGKSSDRQ